TVFKAEVEPFILELPEYKVPTLEALLKNTWNKSKGFLIRVVTVMFAMSVVIWALSSFNFSGFTENINESFLASLGKLMAPIFVPLGFEDWRISVSILTGLGAKEIVVNTLSVLFGNLETILPTVFTGVSAYAFLIFSALYTPCIAALATMRKEYGNKMMLISLSYQFALAWIAAFFVNSIGNLIMGNSNSSIIELLIGGVIIALAGFILINVARKKSSGCSSCSSCSSCPSNSTCCTVEESQIKEQEATKSI
ncbi:MAG: FeoB-associated Cys-rich membrane protein, partial [Peptostreptococcaceae bacterium]